jgi:hypothetical protein
MTERDREICFAYRIGWSSAKVGRMFGLTDRRVLQILERHGVERRKPKPPPLVLNLRRAS